MRKKILLMLTLTVAAGLILFKVAKVENSSEREELKAIKSIESFFNAFEKKDIDKMIALSDDERVRSDSEHKEHLEGLIEDNYVLKDYEIKKSKYINESEYEFDIEINYMNKEKEEATFKAVKENNKYILKLGEDRFDENYDDSRNRIEIIGGNTGENVITKE